MFEKITVVDAFEEIAAAADQLDLRLHKDEETSQLRFYIQNLDICSSADCLISFDYTMVDGKIIPKYVRFPIAWGFENNGKCWILHEIIMDGSALSDHWKWLWNRRKKRLINTIAKIREQSVQLKKYLNKASLCVERFLH